MKTNHPFVLVLATCALFVFNRNASAQPTDPPLIVHEWGTFTSFQAGDGKLISWKPIKTAELPDFVYSWNKPGPDRPPLNGVRFGLVGGKGELRALQRLETPVVYFYSDREQTMDLSVNFPAGYITEWFPQATQIGPAVPVFQPAPDSPAANASQVSERLIRWTGLQIEPSKAAGALAQALPTDASGSHYFAARETDADLVHSSAGVGNGPAHDTEKFLFYRGLGNFTTPLTVTMDLTKGVETVELSNSGTEPISNLFVLNVHGYGVFAYVSELPPGAKKAVCVDPCASAHPALSAQSGEFANKISLAMAKALTESGLYQREAEAMIHTWDKSWFAEEGMRVMYVLPQAWTERTLPMNVKPEPRELVRVMVGRAEILPPTVEQTLARELNDAQRGDANASAAARETLKSLGRFAEPAFYRVLAATKPKPAEQGRLMALLAESQSPGP